MAVKFGHAMGAHVTVLSHSPGKREDALALGADDFFVTKDEAVFKENAGRFDFIIDTVSATHDYNAYLNLLRRDGIMVLVGLPDPTPLSAGPLIMKRRSLAGSLIGGIRETQEMLDFCARHGVAADVEVIPIQEVSLRAHAQERRALSFCNRPRKLEIRRSLAAQARGHRPSFCTASWEDGRTLRREHRRALIFNHGHG